jgi:hypothetical protein
MRKAAFPGAALRLPLPEETGVDPGHLSRVLSSRSDLSLRNLRRILDALRASLVIRPGTCARRVTRRYGTSEYNA